MNETVAILESELSQAKIDLKKLTDEAKYSVESLNRANKACSLKQDYVLELKTAIDILNGVANLDKKV